MHWGEKRKNPVVLPVDWSWGIKIKPGFKIKCISGICPLKGPRSNKTPVTTSTPTTQFLVSKNQFPLKGSKSTWRTNT